MISPDEPGITRDFFFKRKVIVYQHKKGYRFSVDAPILADFLPTCAPQAALEIGTGCGIVSLLALFHRKYSLIHGIEVQTPLSRLARANAEENGFMENFHIVNGDFGLDYPDFSGIRHVFSNPPFYPLSRGRLSPNPEVRDAKFETRITVADVMVKTFSILGPKASLYMVLPYDRFEEVIRLTKKIGFHIGRLRHIFSFAHGKPERFLIQLTNYDVFQEELQPLIIFKEKGVYTPEMDRILSGNAGNNSQHRRQR